MKKVYLAALSIGLLGTAMAQTTTAEKGNQPYERNTKDVTFKHSDSYDRAPGDPIVTYDFSTMTGVATPTDTDGHMWTVETSLPASMDGYIGAITSSTAANGFGCFNGIEHLVAGSVDPQNVSLELGPFDMSSFTAATLTFEQAHRAFNSDLCFVEFSTDGGSSWPTSIQINEDHPGNGATFNETITLNAAVLGGATNAMIRFRWEELSGDDEFGSGYGWMVDDVTVLEPYNTDLELTASYHRMGLGEAGWDGGLEYFLIPTTQISEITFIGETENFGGTTQANAVFTADVTGAGTYTGTSTAADIPVGGTDSVSCTATFTPSAVGTYDIVYYWGSDGTEDVTGNDSAYSAIAVTDYLYSRSNGAISSTFSNWSGGSGQPAAIGNEMVIFADGVVGGADVYFGTGADEGDEVVVVLYKFDGTDFQLELEHEHTLGAGEPGTFVEMRFEESMDVVDGDIILVTAGHYGTDTPIGMTQSTQQGSVIGTDGAGAFVNLIDPEAVAIDLHMRSYVGIEDEPVVGFNIGQNVPNPFDNTSMISYSLENEADVSIEIVDITGKVVKTINKGTQTAGDYQIILDANDFAEGSYFYTFTVGTQKVTKRMVITK
ncbi:MAG: T9SS type A sorting domain-containing protein [Crocinitomicaceae bacterium]|nr:T9SS type A sorting domain-containing protein [Crocinitomicaceae bacterium]